MIITDFERGTADQTATTSLVTIQLGPKVEWSVGPGQLVGHSTRGANLGAHSRVFVLACFRGLRQ